MVSLSTIKKRIQKRKATVIRKQEAEIKRLQEKRVRLLEKERKQQEKQMRTQTRKQKLKTLRKEIQELSPTGKVIKAIKIGAKKVSTKQKKPKKRKRKTSNKGWHKIGDYSSRQAAERRVSKLSSHIKTKITERWAKVYPPRKKGGRRRYKPISHMGGKKAKIYRLWAK